MNLGVLASGAGTTLQSIVDAISSGRLNARVALVISNNSASGAMQRAQAAGIPTAHISGKTHPDDGNRDRAMAVTLQQANVDTVLLAGYMKAIGPHTLEAFKGRMLNTHPALLPKFGGQGYYGRRVHEAVIAAGEAQSGATVHLVDGAYDTGEILAQIEVPVLAEDTAESLEGRVKSAEQALLLDVLNRWAIRP